ncbi:uncharacterized protein LOC118199064 [Stegodyphus dumicola]|uniref:uncharacterized protein LOC118199064 n=1 Tax=Stegodyphus dumicola TaxID=202533 RepID=UPI0015B35DCE|nr:uncharacterized protein LOC118199064 [Stegodyphus dumicola]
MPRSISETAIFEDLKLRKLPVLKVEQFTKRIESDIIKLPIYFIELERNKLGEAIYNLNNIFNFNITIEKYAPKTKRPIQCFKCQSYGHSQANCYKKEICCKCSQNHRSNTCSLKREEKPICYFCRGEHVSSYRGCPIYKKRFQTPKPAEKTQEIPNLKDFSALASKSETEIKEIQRNIPFSAVFKQQKIPADNDNPISQVFSNPKVFKFIQDMNDVAVNIKSAKSSTEKLSIAFLAVKIALDFAEEEN